MIKQQVLTSDDGVLTVRPHAGRVNDKDIPFKYFTIQRYQSAYLHIDAEQLDNLIELLTELKKATQLTSPDQE